MKAIYSNTKRGILWLGGYRDPDAAAASNPNAIMTEAEVEAAFGVLEDLHSGRQHKTKTQELRAAYFALETLLQLPWWQRIWTVQEALLPKYTLLRYGNSEIPFKKCCYSYSPYITEAAMINFGVLEAAMNERRCSKDSACTFSILLNAFRGRLASDPRDKIFGLSGLAGTVAADYSLDTNDVFEGAVHSSVNDTGSLAPLLRVPEPNRSPELPTWAPD
jgi:hypothetical protein